jgi:hypothetical protein
LGLSAQSGHAGPDSTSWYIHSIEDAFYTASRRARPEAWSHPPAPEALSERFSQLCDAQVVDVPPLPVRRPREVPPQDATGLTIEQRLEIVWDLQCNYRVDAVAAKAMVPELVVVQVVRDMAATLAQVGLAPTAPRDALRLHCQFASAYALWARAAHQPKHRLILQRLAALERAEDWSSLCRTWFDYLLCRHHDDIALDNGRSAVRLVEFLRAAGVPKDSLATASAATAPPLPPEVLSLGMPHRDPAPARRGQADHRLFLTEAGVCARSANAASVSMRGLHWVFLVMGSALLGRGDI